MVAKQELEERGGSHGLFRHEVLCRTLADNNCDLLTITSMNGSDDVITKRKGVVITGRVHPGETNASWMMKGVIDFLTGNSLDAKILRDNFVFKIIPMLNPDGVVNGNYRCSLAGVDLNRVWLSPSRRLHPTIFHAKAMIEQFVAEQEVVLICDLHGHSRKKNIFLYGCENSSSKIPLFGGTAPSEPSGLSLEEAAIKLGPYGTAFAPQLLERIYAQLLAKNAPDIFSFADCCFEVQKSKESTARVVCWREFQRLNSFTLEASFAGSTVGDHIGKHFTTRDFEFMGKILCETLLDYCNPTDRSAVQRAARELLAIVALRSLPSAGDKEMDSATAGAAVATDPMDGASDSDGESSSSGERILNIVHNNNNSSIKKSGMLLPLQVVPTRVGILPDLQVTGKGVFMNRGQGGGSAMGLAGGSGEQGVGAVGSSTLVGGGGGVGYNHGMLGNQAAVTGSGAGPVLAGISGPGYMADCSAAVAAAAAAAAEGEGSFKIGQQHSHGHDHTHKAKKRPKRKRTSRKALAGIHHHAAPLDHAMLVAAMSADLISRSTADILGMLGNGVARPSFNGGGVGGGLGGGLGGRKLLEDLSARSPRNRNSLESMLIQGCQAATASSRLCRPLSGVPSAQRPSVAAPAPGPGFSPGSTAGLGPVSNCAAAAAAAPAAPVPLGVLTSSNSVPGFSDDHDGYGRSGHDLSTCGVLSAHGMDANNRRSSRLHHVPAAGPGAEGLCGVNSPWRENAITSGRVPALGSGGLMPLLSSKPTFGASLGPGSGQPCSAIVPPSVCVSVPTGSSTGPAQSTTASVPSPQDSVTDTTSTTATLLPDKQVTSIAIDSSSSSSSRGGGGGGEGGGGSGGVGGGAGSENSDPISRWGVYLPVAHSGLSLRTGRPASGRGGAGLQSQSGRNSSTNLNLPDRASLLPGPITQLLHENQPPANHPHQHPHPQSQSNSSIYKSNSSKSSSNTSSRGGSSTARYAIVGGLSLHNIGCGWHRHVGNSWLRRRLHAKPHAT
ncbi:hypothetical protein CBR_g45991 [Chara braunii]|uniref:Peptidase M14 domain-containing protein n=1 Tax=Chara braunii TaxID=69332 RepID=A0A388LZY9_CHABU|nr:hypothetical protein CBR_g45991 [Chara braunii]|eukprot:GBG87835.1 hypothetical protein CBR_g45991 [Chara braunii]